MKYAVVASGGKQYPITEGQTIDVEHIPLSKKGPFTFDKVLLYRSENDFLVGKPYLSNITVKGSIIGDKKGEKIRVATYKAKVRNRKVFGHRQHLTTISIDSITKESEVFAKAPRRSTTKSK